MKVKLVGFLVLIVILGLFNTPGIPIPVRLTFYSVMLAGSTLASSTAYYYFSSIPDTQYSLLVSASKSFIVWHAVYAGSNSIYLGCAAIYFDEEEQNWIPAENDTCLMNPLLHAKSIFATALAQFQLFRFTFKYLPQQFLSFNHEAWAYPFAASVPATAFILQILIFFYNGTICDQLPLEYYLKKLNLQTESTPLVTRFQVTTLMLMFIVLLEFLIQIKIQLKSLKSWIRKRNRIVQVAPANSIPLSTIQCNRSHLMNPTLAPIDVDNFAAVTSASSSICGQNISDLDDRVLSGAPSNVNSSSPSQYVRYYFAELTIYVIAIFFVNFLYTFIFGYGNVTVYIAIVFNDFLCFALPMAVVLSSDKILDFIQNKLAQFNLQYY